MKISIIILLLFLCKCSEQSVFSTHSNNANKIIALQPLGKFDYDEQQLTFIRNQLSDSFHIRVLILKPIDIPPSFFKKYNIDEMCSADSLIKFLLKICNDTIVDVVGLTHNDIYTISDNKIQLDNKDTVVTGLKGIFGLGYINRGSCIVSDYRIMSTDEELLNRRLRNVIFHEIGHNLGLPHCSNDSCLMSGENGSIPNLDKNSGNYCTTCMKNLHNRWRFRFRSKQISVNH